MNNPMTRIGVFYDGNYFYHVSNYYSKVHKRKSRLSIKGLHDFIRNQVAEQEKTDVRTCQIVDAHYFRGRYTAKQAKEKENQLYYDRVFDDILSGEGVVTHYLPLKPNQNNGWQEKGIDVWFALEAFELAIYKRFDVLVLIASDGDYLPLLRKLNTLGVRVMVLAWDLPAGETHRGTQTSQALLSESTYPIEMAPLIDARSSQNDNIINNLFC